MELDKLTGVEYPTIELGGKEYTIRFTRALFYKMGKAGIKFNPQVTSTMVQVPFHELVDVMKLAIDFQGTEEELAEMLFDKRDQVVMPLVNAWGNLVLPTLKLRTQAAAANTPAGPQIQ